MNEGAHLFTADGCNPPTVTGNSNRFDVDPTDVYKIQYEDMHTTSDNRAYNFPNITHSLTHSMIVSNERQNLGRCKLIWKFNVATF